ncbi:hypothetical protein [Pseudonocardia spinosispora]|uniref:hypothetical protein n=1 Tax=Pseudonocardia spinosispora TaxID=103441 RepID=UPI0003FB27F8|nr:hypothetical protein [Pseudonocardia spinosispora]
MARVGPRHWLTADEGGQPQDAQVRASGQVDRLVDEERRTAALIEALGDDSEPESARASGEQLRAMTPPQHDDAQITAMADARGRLTPRDRQEPATSWWRRLLSRLRRR